MRPADLPDGTVMGLYLLASRVHFVFLHFENFDRFIAEKGHGSALKGQVYLEAVAALVP